MNFDGKVAVVTVVDRDEAAGQKLVEETGSNGKLALIDENAGDVCLRVRCQVGIQNRIGNVADLIWMSFRHRLGQVWGKSCPTKKTQSSPLPKQAMIMHLKQSCAALLAWMGHKQTGKVFGSSRLSCLLWPRGLTSGDSCLARQVSLLPYLGHTPVNESVQAR